jgi:hypothetical protein
MYPSAARWSPDDRDPRISLLASSNGDQRIHAIAGASIHFIRLFERGNKECQSR